MSNLEQSGNAAKKPTQANQSIKQIKRTKGHEAILKVKEIESHLDMMRRRNKYLQVRDQLNRSLTIQHEKKLQQHQQLRLQAKNQKQEMEKYHRYKMFELETIKQRNMSVRDEREKNIAQSLQKFYNEKVVSYRTIRVEKDKNEESILKFRQSDQKQKVDRRRSVHEMEETSKVNISRFRENRHKDSERYKSNEYDSLMSLAANKQKQLEKLAKIEQDMVKKSSESMQISQLTKKKMKQVFGRLPEIKNNSVTRGSTSNTQILLI